MSANMAELFRRITAGVHVIGVAGDSARDAFTASSVSHVSYRPLVLVVAVHPEHRGYALLRQRGIFAVSVLRHDELELAHHFGTAPEEGVDKLECVPWCTTRQGSPRLTNALAWFDCAVFADVAAGDHRLVLGRVVEGALRDSNAVPLQYAQTGNLDGSERLYPPDFGTR